MTVFIGLFLSAGSSHAQTYGILREVFADIGGVAIADLTNAPAYPSKPTSTNYVTDLFESPTDVLDQYGQRMHGYIIPPQTGNYTFWIATDDAGALYLSTDENPANARPIATVNGWTPPRNWSVEGNQQSAAIRLQAGKPYYISALMKEGGGGDNLAVRWLMPDGTDQAPISATNLLPWGVSFSAPVIAKQPLDATGVEGGYATFKVELKGVSIASYQWRINGTNMDASGGPALVLGPLKMSDHLAKIDCIVSNDKGSETSAAATLSVTPDVTPPQLKEIISQGATRLLVSFSETVSQPTATTAANYVIDGAEVQGARLGENKSTVELTLSAMDYGSSHTLRVSQVCDAAATPNPIAAGAALEFKVSQFAPSDVGGAVKGSDTFVDLGEMDAVGSGAGISGASDQLHFSFEQRTGNFDLRVRVQSLNAPNPWAAAGLMVRESLAAGSRFAASLSTPSVVGCSFQYRPTADVAAVSSGSFPVNYPMTWLRIGRSGNAFTGYASMDGTNWTQTGTVTMALPSTLYVGMTVFSRSATAMANVEFRNYGIQAGGTIQSYVATGEPLGPSTRRTGLVFSEIMYHPRARADGRETEFVEIYNGDIIALDLTGHSISGNVDYRFPDGTKLAAGAFLVVAKSPADLKAAYGLKTVLGPYTGSLGNNSGALRLSSPAGAVLLEAGYASNPPWPVAADGAGHSLVLSAPSYGEGSWKAWSASSRVGGSPGGMDPLYSNPWASIVINEFLVNPGENGPSGYVELYNHGNQEVDISGCYITDSPSTNKFKIPPQTIISPRGYAVFYAAPMGLVLKASGETLFLVNPEQTAVLDAIRYEGQEAGFATGRHPDGAATVRVLSSPTPGAVNAIYRVADIVMNEIMYHPISENDDDEFVELYNRGAAEADLSGWKFTHGIDFDFPPNTKLAPRGYLVVAKNAAQLTQNYPNLGTSSLVGNFKGSLSANGERLQLAKPAFSVATNEFGVLETNRFFAVVDEVVYDTGGRWSKKSDGGGSSLELIDPNSDHLRPSNWADSDETAKAPWSTIEFTGVLDNGNSGFPPNQLQIELLGGGECLVDNVEVMALNGPNRIANSTFESGQSPWVFQGNHRASTIDATGGYEGGKCLHVRATGRGDTGANRIRIALSTPLTTGSAATIRARIRWLAGWPEFLMRLRGNWLEATGPMALPRNLGTPGAPNSRALPNAGPAIYEVAHSPVLPAANQSAVVSARVADPDGVGTVNLVYRIDPGTTWTTAAMNDSGTGGDAIAADGVFSATIPGKAGGTLAAFYVMATDKNSGSASARFPAEAPAKECLIRWGEYQPGGNLGVYRLWQTRAKSDFLYSREPLANDPIDATFVYGNSRVVYNIEMRGKGSPWHGGSIGGDYIFSFPKDDQLLSAQDMSFVTVGNLGSDDALQREQAAFWMLQQMGVPNLHRRFCLFFNNGNRQGNVYEDTEEPNGDYAQSWAPQHGKGDLHKIEDWFEFDDNASGFGSVDATLQKFTTTGGVIKLARYRWDWRLRAVQNSANNYTNLFTLVEAVNLQDTNYTAQVENLVDIEGWMRVFAVEHTVGNWDAYGHGRGKNMYAYKPKNGKWILLPWDIDFVLGSSSDSPTSDVFGCNDPTISRMYGHPPFLRAYWRAFRDLVNGPLKAENIGELLDARYQALVANGISNFANPGAIKTFVQQRRDYLLSRLNAVAATFAITSNNGNNFTSPKSFATLTGTAPIEVKTIEINGIAYPVTWTGVTSWTLGVPLSTGNNNLTVTGLDLRGQPVAGASDNIAVAYAGAASNPLGSVVIHEIQYHPLKADSEFVEIYNTSATTTFDLTGWRLDGADYIFPEGTLLPANGYKVVVKNRAGFATAFGQSVIPVGEYAGVLDHGGETLQLLRPAGETNQYEVIDIVRYNDKLPWPAAADGQGPSLQLIDPLQDNWRPGNWGSSATNAAVLATPGAANSVKATLAAFPKLWINEVQPENIGAIKDASGKAGPWIELYNAGTQAISLTGLYLSASPSNLTEWAFPQNVSVGAGQYVQVWADGEAGQTTSEIHAGIRLNPGTGYVLLSMMQQGNPAVVDYLKYDQISAGRTYGSIPDGQPHIRRMMHYPTPAAVNNPDALPLQVFINEWMASNTRTFTDPVDGGFDDWFELFNAGGQDADISGYYLSDTLTNATQWLVPTGTIVPAGGHLLVWADGETGQNGMGVHANFKLSASGESIALFTPGGSLVDSVAFGPQTADASQGRWPDGAPEPFYFMPIPTPGGANSIAAGNHPPIIPLISEQIVTEGETVSFTVGATDVDAPAQTLTYSLDAGAPAGAGIEALTGRFAWTPAGSQVPSTNVMVIRVTDNGDPVQSSVRSVRVLVNKLNHVPVLEAVADPTVSEGTTLEVSLKAADVDAGQALRFTIVSGAQQGMNLNMNTGLLTWAPLESQGPGSYPVVVRVFDDGAPALSASQPFTIVVAEVNTRPELAAISDQVVQQGGTLNLKLLGSDVDVPVNVLTYSLDEGTLPGAVLDPVSGVLTWTPSSAQIPSTNRVTVRLTDNGLPPLSVSRSFDVVATKPPPWKYFTTTGTASASILYVYLTRPGDLYIDDLKIVAGSVPDAGANTVPNGDFESPLSGSWTVSANHAASAIVTNVAHSGKSSLHMIASSGGTTRDSSIYQTITPALTANATYTLSYWCMAGTNDADLVIRLSGFGIQSTNTIVATPNTAPVLPVFPTQEIPEGVAWSMQVTATDADAAQKLTFSLEPGAPSGVSITSDGLVSWRPTEAQGPSTNSITVKVTDNGSPALSASRSFTVVVDEVNAAPVLAAIDSRAVKVGESLTFTAVATDADLPAQKLTFSLEPGAPSGVSITSDGLVSWRPTEAQGPSTNSITVKVTDNGSPAMSGTRSFTVVVNEENSAPAINAIEKKTVKVGALLSFPVTAADMDLPAQKLTFNLESDAPAGASMTPDGVFEWTPGLSQGPSTNVMTVKVTDNGVPAMSATRFFTVVVEAPVAAPHILKIELTANKEVKVTWTSELGIVYRLQYKHFLDDPNWTTVDSIAATQSTTSLFSTKPVADQGYFRVQAITGP